MKLSEEKSKLGDVELKKSAAISRESVRVIAETAGIAQLSTEACELLAQDLTFRLRDIVNCSAQLLRCTRRRLMTCDDFNYALRLKDSEPIYGSIDNSNFVHIAEADIYVRPEVNLDLDSYVASSLDLDVIKEPCLNPSWLHLTGQKDAPIESEKGASKLVTPAHNEYYLRIVRAISENDGDSIAFICEDLKSNSRLQPMVPQLFGFFCHAPKVCAGDFDFLIRLLDIVEKILQNGNIFYGFFPMAEQFLTTLLNSACSSAPLDASDKHWTVRERCATYIDVVLRTLEENTLNDMVTREVVSVLSNPEATMESTYGAVYIALTRGASFLETYVLPYWSAFAARHLEDGVTSSVQRVHMDVRQRLRFSEDVVRMRNLLIRAAQIVVSDWIANDDVTSKTRSNWSFFLTMREHLEVELVTWLPTIDSISKKELARLQENNASKLPDRQPTGDELLAAMLFSSPVANDNSSKLLSSRQKQPQASGVHSGETIPRKGRSSSGKRGQHSGGVPLHHVFSQYRVIKKRVPLTLRVQGCRSVPTMQSTLSTQADAGAFLDVSMPIVSLKNERKRRNISRCLRVLKSLKSCALNTLL